MTIGSELTDESAKFMQPCQSMKCKSDYIVGLRFWVNFRNQTQYPAEFINKKRWSAERAKQPNKFQNNFILYEIADNELFTVAYAFNLETLLYIVK